MPYRIPGCESRNHSICIGTKDDLWQCANCGKTVCLAEGSSAKPQYCDDCWNVYQELTDVILSLSMQKVCEYLDIDVYAIADRRINREDMSANLALEILEEIKDKEGL